MSQDMTSLPDADSAEPPSTSSELLLIRHNGSGADKHELGEQVVTIGRDVRNDLVLDTESVSRLHARLEREQGNWFVTDLGSTNGTYLNTVKLPAYAPHTVQLGDKIRMGEYRMELYQTDSTFGTTGTPTALVSPEFDEDEQEIEEISLARQLFGSVDEALAESVPEVPPGPKPIPDAPPEPEPFLPPLPPIATSVPIEEATPAIEAFVPEPYQIANLDRPRDFRPLTDMLAQRAKTPLAQPFSFSIWPTVLMQSGQVIVSILNESNTTRRFTIEMGESDGVECVDGLISAEIPAGAEHRSALNIRATSRPLVGDQQNYPFHIVVNKDENDQRIAEGGVRAEPRFTKAMAYFVGILMMMTFIVWFASQYL